MSVRIRVSRHRPTRLLVSLASMVFLLASCAAPALTPPPGSGAPPGSTSPLETPAASVPLVDATPTMLDKIAAAELAGTLDHDTALLYEVYAALDARSLPAEYQSGAAQTAEATGALAELVGRLDQLTPELQAKVGPFLRRPTEADSFWALRQLAGGQAAAPLGLAVAAPDFAIEYDFVDVVSPTPIRVWYATALGDTERQAAQRLATEIDASDMWGKETEAMVGRQPCSDLEQEAPRNGGSAALDVYLIYPLTGLDWYGRNTGLQNADDPAKSNMGVTVAAQSGTGCAWITYIALNARLGWDDLRATMAHELFHAFQLSFRSSEQADRKWWKEATATWVEDLVYPALNTEQGYLEQYWSHALGPNGPLDSTDKTAEYAAYLWPFYARQSAGGDEGVIGRLWEEMQGAKSPLEVLRDSPGWTAGFKEFALWNWNKDPLLDYRDSGQPIPESVLGQNAGCLKENCIVPLGKQDLYIDLEHASVVYYQGTPEITVEQLRFDLADLRGKPGAGLQAIITIGQPGPGAETRTEDWTDLDKRVFCIAREDVREIVLVVSNSGIDADQKLQGKIAIEALAAHCGGGLATFSRTQTSSHAAVAQCGVSSSYEETATLTMVVTFAADGTGTATLNAERNSTEVSQDVLCGDGSVHTKTVSERISGTKPTDVTWNITDDGVIDFYAGWDFVTGGTTVTTTSCTAPASCDGTTTEEYVLEYDALYFTAAGDPSRSVITGTMTEDDSGDGYTDVIIYTWTLER